MSCSPHASALLRRALLGVLLPGLVMACSPEPRIVATDGPLTRRLEAPGVFTRADDPVPESTIDLTRRLNVTGPLQPMVIADSLLVGATGQPGGRFTATVPSVDSRRVAALRLHYTGTLGGRLRLEFRRHGETAATRCTGWVEVGGGGKGELVELPLSAPWKAEGRLAEVAILVPGNEVGTISVRDVQLVLQPERPVKVALDGQLREVFAPEVDEELRWPVDVAAATTVHFDYGVHPEVWGVGGDGVWFEALARVGGRERVLWSDWLAPGDDPEHREWKAARIELSEWSGRRIEFVLRSRPSPPAAGIFGDAQNAENDQPLFGVPRVVAQDAGHRNVVLIVIDTLRHDGLGVYGNPRTVSPNIDRFADRGLVFEQAFTAGSWTHPSTASLLSGWNPGRHGLGMGPAGTTQLDPATPLVSEALQGAGWATAAVSNNAIVSPDEGFARGFDSFDTRPFVSDQVYGAQRVTRGGIEWIEDHADAPFFLYLHYFDPHDRYQAPPPFTRSFVDSSLESRVKNTGVKAGRVNPFADALMDGDGTLRASADELAYLRSLYDGEVAYADHWIGVLLDELERRGLLETTLVVITSDHGEEFLDHGMYKHGHTLYGEQIHVPLIVLDPETRSARRVSDPVSLMDLAFTIREFAGLEPEVSLPLSPENLLRRAPSEPARALVAENVSQARGAWSGAQRSLIEWPHKAIESASGRRWEIFDLSKDPKEQNDLSSAPTSLSARMLSVLDSLLAGSLVEGQEDVPLDPALLEKLKAMGYVH